MSRLQWEFIADILCLPQVDCGDVLKMSYTDLIKSFRERWHPLNIAHSNIRGIIMQTVQFLKELKKCKICDTFEMMQEVVRLVREILTVRSMPVNASLITQRTF